MEDRLAHTQEVAGSSPASATNSPEAPMPHSTTAPEKCTCWKPTDREHQIDCRAGRELPRPSRLDLAASARSEQGESPLRAEELEHNDR